MHNLSIDLDNTKTAVDIFILNSSLSFSLECECTINRSTFVLGLRYVEASPLEVDGGTHTHRYGYTHASGSSWTEEVAHSMIDQEKAKGKVLRVDERMEFTIKRERD